MDRNGITKNQVVIGGLWLWHLGTWLFNNLYMLVIYRLKHPFFEQYKVHNEPWPWDENYKEWREFLNKTLVTLFINIALIFPASVSLRQYLFNWEVRFSFELEDIPSPLTLFT